MRSELTRVTLTLATLVISLAGCADFSRGAYWANDDDTATGDTADTGVYTYADDVHPLLDAGCKRCHAPAGSAGATAFLIVSDDIDSSYTSTLEFINLDDPAASRLLSKMAGKGHAGAVVFDDHSPEYELVLAWIEQGAPP